MGLKPIECSISSNSWLKPTAINGNTEFDIGIIRAIYSSQLQLTGSGKVRFFGALAPFLFGLNSSAFA
jgi:hypothetical protein